MKKPADGPVPVALVNLERVLMDEDCTLKDLEEKLRKSIDAVFSKVAGSPGTADYGRELTSSTSFRRFRRVIWESPEFWRHLGIRRDGRWILATLVHLGYAVTVFSEELRRAPDLWEVKMRWCYENLFSGMKGCRFVIGESSCDLDADVYVDDRPGRASSWLALHSGSIAIVPAREWNKDFQHSRAIRFERDRNAALVEDLLSKARRNEMVDIREKCVRCSVNPQMPGEQVCPACRSRLWGALIWWQHRVLGMTVTDLSKEHALSRERIKQFMDRHDEILSKRMKKECRLSGWGQRLVRSGALPPFGEPWGDIVTDPRHVMLPPEDAGSPSTPEEVSRQISTCHPGLDVPVDDLELTVRLSNRLDGHGIRYLGELASLEERQVSRMYQLGRMTLAEVKELLGKHGLRLGMKLTGWIPPSFLILLNHGEIHRSVVVPARTMSFRGIVNRMFSPGADPSRFEIRFRRPGMFVAQQRDLQYEPPERMNEVQDVSLSQLMIFDISEKKAAVPGGSR